MLQAAVVNPPTLDAKVGPGRAPPDAAAAAARVAAYERAVRAANPPVRAPALHLGEAALATLFGPRTLAALVTRPLKGVTPSPAEKDPD